MPREFALLRTMTYYLSNVKSFFPYNAVNTASNSVEDIPTDIVMLFLVAHGIKI